MARDKHKNAGAGDSRGAEERAGGNELVPSEAPRLIVGIGASAGGLAAFKSFFAHTPGDTGMAFVLVQHLDPQHKSMLVELLAPAIMMPVVQAKDGMAVAANHVFIIPPDATLTIEGGLLRVSSPAPARQTRRPIDTFFCSLAEDQGELAVAIVLSGVGSDGSLGIETIKEHGGLSLAQAASDATPLSGMPYSAAATGLVDHVVPIESMPDKLVNYQRHLNEVTGHKDGDGTRQDTSEHLARIGGLLRTRTGHDFRDYKQATFMRRIQRRMQVLQIETVPAYVEQLKREPGELDLLFRDLLIGVTEFFRNREAFDALAAAVIPKIIAGKSAGETIRVWVPGCATGEEVYSIAILFREGMKDDTAAPTITVFGTDIDANAIEVARAARYLRTIAGLSAEHLARWFAKDGEDYCPIKAIRDMCVFSTHSLVKDPPFSKLDLISCRNVLIYFNNDLQHRIIQTFHYALKPGGYLFLGPSEGVTREAKLFAMLDKKHRILQRRDAVATLPVLSPPATIGVPAQAAPRRVLADDQIDKRARSVMEKHSPAYVVIDGRHDIVRFSGAETRHYLEPSAGMASLNLFTILRKDLRPAVRTAVRQAGARRQPVMHEDLSIKIDGQSHWVTLIVEPIGESGSDDGLCVVAFHDLGAVRTGAGDELPAATGESDVHALEHELKATKDQLQAAVDDLETHIEESKSAAEEYQSVNEELQSTNEELETAKEEMQSVNEELQTINGEMQAKNELLTRINSDLQNLMNSTEIATVFLDNELRIKSFTPATTELFPLRDADRGRPLTEIVSKIADPQLIDDMAKVQRTLAMVVREVQLENEGATFLMRMRPYRTVDNRIDGLTITFTDITERRKMEDALRRWQHVFQHAGFGMVLVDHRTHELIAVNPAFARMHGFAVGELVGKPFAAAFAAQARDELPEHARQVAEKGHYIYEAMHVRKDGTTFPVLSDATAFKDADGRTQFRAISFQDITERREREEHLGYITRELSHRSKNLLAVISALAAQTARHSGSLDDFQNSFSHRLQALARSHDVLVQHDWKGGPIEDLVRSVVETFSERDQGRFEIDGPQVLLKPEATQYIGLALHELATNAAKYGALSASAGKVSIQWRFDAGNRKEPHLHITWRERGGPPVGKPTRKGFGHIVTEQMVASSLDATVALDFAREGVRWSIDIPARSVVSGGESMEK